MQSKIHYIYVVDRFMHENISPLLGNQTVRNYYLYIINI